MENGRAGMKGSFVFLHKETKKANKDVYFIYGSLRCASRATQCPYALNKHAGDTILPMGTVKRSAQERCVFSAVVFPWEKV